MRVTDIPIDVQVVVIELQSSTSVEPLSNSVITASGHCMSGFQLLHSCVNGPVLESSQQRAQEGS